MIALLSWEFAFLHNKKFFAHTKVSSPRPEQLALSQSTTANHHRSHPPPPPSQNHPPRSPSLHPPTPDPVRCPRATRSPLPSPLPLVPSRAETCESPPVALPDLSARWSHISAPPGTRPRPPSHSPAPFAGRKTRERRRRKRRRRGIDLVWRSPVKVGLHLPFTEATPPSPTDQSSAQSCCRKRRVTRHLLEAPPPSLWSAERMAYRSVRQVCIIQFFIQLYIIHMLKIAIYDISGQ